MVDSQKSGTKLASTDIRKQWTSDDNQNNDDHQNKQLLMRATKTDTWYRLTRLLEFNMKSILRTMILFRISKQNTKKEKWVRRII